MKGFRLKKPKVLNGVFKQQISAYQEHVLSSAVLLLSVLWNGDEQAESVVRVQRVDPSKSAAMLYQT